MPDDLPAHPSINQLKKQAKDLLRGFARKDPSVIDRFRSIRRYASLSEEDLFRSPVRLHDAQYAVALRYGFRSWRHLSDHCTRKHEEKVMDKTVTQEFNELKGLPNRATQRLLREIDAGPLARALLGADQGTRDKVFANMSARAVSLIKDEMSGLEGLDQAAIEAAMSKMLSIQKKLVSRGEIVGGYADAEEAPPPEPIRIIEEKGSVGFDLDELKILFVELAAKSRSAGLLSLESDVRHIADPIIRKGLELIVDGTDPTIVESIMRNMLEKEVRFIQTKYQAVIEGVLGVQQGDAPQTVRQIMESRLP